MEMGYPEKLEAIRRNIRQVIVGKDEVVNKLLIALICSGHVLIEDMPGLGKTTLAAALAASLGCTFKRIQFTPDVLPSDITGFTMFNLKTGEQELHMGAVMNQIVLADEINRTSPKTQSALLEIMQENQVTIDGREIELSYKEFELLSYFIENQGIALSREKILNNVWNYDYFGDARTIDTHVKKLRSKMGDKGDYIKTIWGMGYKFEVNEG